MTDRNKPGVVFWGTVVVVALPFLYVASFGPAMWLFWSEWTPAGYYDVLQLIYAPIFHIMDHGPEPISHALIRYGALFH